MESTLVRSKAMRPRARAVKRPPPPPPPPPAAPPGKRDRPALAASKAADSFHCPLTLTHTLTLTLTLTLP